ncbi:MAG: hypothetical protein RDU14_17445 [Melioribacteraceae bacterium]|nr:hypothetical protein [Melioribacteraceae bacterium]
MARDKTIKFIRSTRANLNTQKSNSGLIQGEPYLITDEGRLAVGLANNDYVDFAKKSEVDAVGGLNTQYVSRTSAFNTTSSSFVDVTDASFSVNANKKYLVLPIMDFADGDEGGSSESRFTFSFPSNTTMVAPVMVNINTENPSEQRISSMLVTSSSDYDFVGRLMYSLIYNKFIIFKVGSTSGTIKLRVRSGASNGIYVYRVEMLIIEI